MDLENLLVGSAYLGVSKDLKLLSQLAGNDKPIRSRKIK
jgi:hypothetical protein